MRGSSDRLATFAPSKKDVYAMKLSMKLVAFWMSFVVVGWGLTACSESKSDSSAPTEEAASSETTEAADEAEEIDPMTLTGVGPVSSVDLGEGIDEELAAKGEELFTSKGCNACHQIDKRLIGPALKGVTQRRNPVWIMNMILNPEQMVKEDPIAKQLLAEYAAPMANQHLTEEEARAMLEYFRKIDAE